MKTPETINICSAFYHNMNFRRDKEVGSEVVNLAS